jgi:hypothetical protein
MNRRHFLSATLATAALPSTLARAQVMTGAPPPSVSPARFLPLLERAKAAMDRHHSQFDLRERFALADFSVASKDMRFHIVDLVGGQSWSYLVAHGKGSDPEHTGFLQRFSNDMGSLATSSGTYKTGEMYDGVHGRAMRLIGLEPTNDLADPRAIVIHGAPYATEDHVAKWGKLGRSEGCFAVAPHMLDAVVSLLGPGRMLYADKV